jgi:acetylornithine deacetylase
VSALEKARIVLDAIDRLEVARHGAQDQPLYADRTHVAPINIGTIAGGDWHSTVPDRVAFEGRFGVFPGESIEDARASLAQALAQVAAGDPWLRDHPPRLSWIEGQFESGATALDHPFVQAVVAAHAAGDAPPPVHGVTYGSDLRLFTNHAHMPAVLYGPGDLEAAHAVDESVATRDIMAAARTSVRLLVRWCGGALP